MYGIYYDYNGYDRQLMAICPTIIECKRLLKIEAEKSEISYKEILKEKYEYSIIEIPIGKWTYKL